MHLTRVLLTGRSQSALRALNSAIQGLSGYEVRVKAITNGHTDPLVGLDYVPDIVILRFQSDQTAELSTWAAAKPGTRPPLIVVGPGADAAAMRLAIRSGARDFLTEPVGKPDLSTALDRVRDELRARAASGRGVIHAFVGAAGGVGTSCIAANIAHMLAVRGQRNTGIVDLDMNFAPLAHHLDLHAERGLIEALASLESLDEHALAGFGALHRSGLRLYASTSKQVMLHKDVSPGRLSRLLELLAEHHQHVVLDVPHVIDDSTATAFGVANEIYIVLEQSTLNVRNAARLARILRDELLVSPERIKLLINRYAKNAMVQPVDVVRTVGFDVVATLPSHYKQMLESSDTGMPLYEADRNAPMTRALLDVVGMILGDQAKASTSLLRRALPSFLRS